jgi:hypothetical protein
MSKENWEDDYEMEPEYDFSNAIRNPYAARFGERTALALLDADVAAVFPDSQAANEALRLMIKTAQAAQELAAGRVS